MPNPIIFIAYVKQETGLDFVAEYKFHPKRKWKIDYFCIEYGIALEVEGGAYTNGRHTRGKGFINDMEKYNIITAMGYKLLRVTPDTLLKQSTIEIIKQTANI